MARRHIIANRRLELAAGVTALALALVLIHDAYEGRGRRRSTLTAYLLP